MVVHYQPSRPWTRRASEFGGGGGFAAHLDSKLQVGIVAFPQCFTQLKIRPLQVDVCVLKPRTLQTQQLR